MQRPTTFACQGRAKTRFSSLERRASGVPAAHARSTALAGPRSGQAVHLRHRGGSRAPQRQVAHPHSGQQQVAAPMTRFPRTPEADKAADVVLHPPFLLAPQFMTMQSPEGAADAFFRQQPSATSPPVAKVPASTRSPPLDHHVSAAVTTWRRSGTKLQRPSPEPPGCARSMPSGRHPQGFAARSPRSEVAGGRPFRCREPRR